MLLEERERERQGVEEPAIDSDNEDSDDSADMDEDEQPQRPVQRSVFEWMDDPSASHFLAYI